MRSFTYILISFLLLTCAGCGETFQSQAIPSFQGFVDGNKGDTGFISDRAIEVEADLKGRVYVSLAHLTPAERLAFGQSAAKNPQPVFSQVVAEQVRFAHNGLRGDGYDLNLMRGTPSFTSVELDGTGVWAEYSVTIDSLIKLSDLTGKDLTPADLVDRRLDLLLPADPTRAFEMGGVACASPADEVELSRANYSHYFDPMRPECALEAGGQLVVTPYSVRTANRAPLAWPEYDRLVADGWLTVAVLFAHRSDEMELGRDSGQQAWSDFSQELLRFGFVRSENIHDGLAERYVRSFGPLQVRLDLFSPQSVSPSRSRAERDMILGSMVGGYEVIYLGGPVLDEQDDFLAQAEVYPAESYQVLFLDSSWSYATHSRQVFGAKRSARDKTGMRHVDVIVNSEPAGSSDGRNVFTLFRNLFEGAAQVQSGASGQDHSWNNLMAYANLAADMRAQLRGIQPEIYGVSGARDNCYAPNGTRCSEHNPAGTVSYTRNDSQVIPDGDKHGLSSSVQVEQLFELAQVTVDVDISHPYIGDLSILLSHDGQEVMLFGRQAAGADLKTSFTVVDFVGQSAQGEWTLRVIDHSDLDSGSLNSWTLNLTPVSDI